MRSALFCVFFAFIVLRRIHAQNNDFRPTPIPLSEWRHEKRTGRAGTLHETLRTEATQAVTAVPAHYWEDALRHSVYLTLVRDKIDQLIAQGQVVSPNDKPGGYDSKEIDDRDLWDKIKTAPFDRIQQEEPEAYGDITIMAKGRLLENKEGFRFAEDVRSKEKCSDDDCLKDVKAFWSVKRVRQRDVETIPGKHHYELTFSVVSQIPKKQRKPHENPIRTFTVKETTPYGVVDKPQEHHRFGHKFHPPTPRPERAIWVHKNIAPARQTGRNHYFNGLDRIFSSFFSDDEEQYDQPPQKFKPSPYGTPPSQYSKIGQVYNEPHQQVPYPYRPYPGKHVRPPLPAPPVHPIQHQYDMGIITASNNIPYAPYSHEHREESSQTVKTTRPAVLPTPLPPLPPLSHNGQSSEVTNMMSIETLDNTSFTPDTTVRYKTYNKYKTTPAKANYFTDHVRPPIYNAPPGVFVTMDKKPFKPMPPLKLMHPTKSLRPNRPIDFRPSPQITDVQSTDSFADNAFRPITMNFDDISDVPLPEKLEIIETTKKVEQKIRKPNANGKKPPKKHEQGKLHRSTTATPDIITAQSTSEDDEIMDWANILGAFTKTTPMISQTERIKVPESTTPMTTSTTPTTTVTRPRSTTTTEAQVTTTTTTVKPEKRTRPPPKFEKQDKIKKHKRLTTTTTSTTTTVAPQTTIKRRTSHDLTPQATSAVPGAPKPTQSQREPQNKTQTTTSTTTSATITTSTMTTTPRPTTTRITTTTQSPSTTTMSSNSTTRSRSKNRFRQSTLMYKGTSIKHDKWNGLQNQTVTTTTSSANNLRRKGSNFHGYVTSTTPRESEERVKNHSDRKPISSIESTTNLTNTNYEDDQYETNSVVPLQTTARESDDYDYDPKDQSEFIFQPPIEIISTPATNKTKCKKKKIPTTQEPNDINTEIFGTTPKTNTVATTKIPNEVSTTNDIFEEFLNFNFNDDDEKDPGNSRADLDKAESSNHDSFLKMDDFEEFLDMHLSDKKDLSDDDQYSIEEEDDSEDIDDEEYENSKIPSIDDVESDEKQESSRDSRSNGAKENRPYTLLELMAMS